MFKIQKFTSFLNEGYTFQDLKFNLVTLTKLEELKKKGLVEDFWVEKDVNILTSLDHNAEVLPDGPVLVITLVADDKIYKYDQFDEATLIFFIDTLENNSIHIPKEEIESIKEINLLLNDGWENFHSSENLADYCYKYRLGKNVWFFKLMFRSVGKLVEVSIRCDNNISIKNTYKKYEIVDKTMYLSAARNLLKAFYKHWNNT